MLINEHTWQFIRKHADDDVRKLALQGAKDEEVDLQMALQQIAGRQTARHKLPTWAVAEGIVYPPHINMEQCSSEQTARYKAKIAGEGESMVDLTGGFGVDFYWMSQRFRQRIYVEQNKQLCDIVQENFRILHHACSVCCCDTATYLTKMEHADVVFLDPARRNEHGGRTYGIEDCTPNVLELLPLLKAKADLVILKLSPMLDWHKAVSDLQGVSEVHIVSVDNECKELLLVLRKEQTDGLLVVCVNGDSTFSFIPTQGMAYSHAGNDLFPGREYSTKSNLADNHLYLYEPNASIMKAGCFAEIEMQYAVQQVSSSSHLFLSSDEIDDFPGRRFQIQAISPVSSKALRATVGALERANVAVRNFPMTAENVRKKLKLKDGGDTYIFATTTSDKQHQLFICRKIG